MFCTLPEYTAAVMAEREREVRRVVAAAAWKRTVRCSEDHGAAGLRLLVRELGRTLARVHLCRVPETAHAPR